MIYVVYIFNLHSFGIDNISLCRKAQYDLLADDHKKTYRDQIFAAKTKSELELTKNFFKINFFTKDSANIINVGANRGQIFEEGESAGNFFKHGGTRAHGEMMLPHEHDGKNLCWFNGWPDVDAIKKHTHSPKRLTFYLYEPAPYNHPTLLEVIKDQRTKLGYKIVFRPYAVSDRPGILTFASGVKTGSEGGSNQHGHIVTESLVVNKEEPGDQIIYNVNVTTLDNEFHTNIISPISLLNNHHSNNNKSLYFDFVKIDTEGFDLSVIRGMRSLLEEKRVNFIVHECHEYMSRANHTLKDAQDFFDMVDFDNFYLSHEYLIMLTGGLYTPEYEDIKYLRNCLAVRRNFTLGKRLLSNYKQVEGCQGLW